MTSYLCAACSQLLPTGGPAGSVYCNRQCLLAAEYRRRSERRRAAAVPVPCRHCGASYHRTAPAQAYCTRACRSAHLAQLADRRQHATRAPGEIPPAQRTRLEATAVRHAAQLAADGLWTPEQALCRARAALGLTDQWSRTPRPTTSPEWRRAYLAACVTSRHVEDTGDADHE